MQHGMKQDWHSLSGGPGKIEIAVSYLPNSGHSLTIDSFELLKVIGKGSFGKVMQVRKKDTQRIYAMKTIRKANIASRPGEITHILAERTVLALVNNPFIVPLKFSFQTPDKLYLVMSFGEFLTPSSINIALNTPQLTVESCSSISKGKASLTSLEVVSMQRSCSVP